MLHFILGVSGSGKSLYAESLLSGCNGSTIYVGTLPANTYYLETIRLHQARRPGYWNLLELVGDPAADLAALGRILQSYRNILLDGLVFYIIYVLTIFDEDLRCFHHEVLSLIKKAARSDGEIIVVDPPLPALLSYDEHRALRLLHIHLARYARQVTFVADGLAASITKSDVARIDRNPSAQACDYRILKLRQPS